MEIEKEPILIIGPSLELVKKIRKISELAVQKHNEIVAKANDEVAAMRAELFPAMDTLHAELLTNLGIPEHEKLMWILDDRYVDAHDLCFMYYTEELAKEVAMHQRDLGGITNN